jgi:hypothetical protein
MLGFEPGIAADAPGDASAEALRPAARDLANVLRVSLGMGIPAVGASILGDHEMERHALTASGAEEKLSRPAKTAIAPV